MTECVWHPERRKGPRHFSWTDVYSGTIVSGAIAGCGGVPTTLASAQGIALDATSVYWTVPNNGTIMKLAKA